MYTAIFAPVTGVKPHPNSDNGLKLIDVAGHQVISTSDIQVNQLVAFFPEGGQLVEEFLFENSEYRKDSSGLSVGKNKDPNKSGLFEHNGRIRTIKLRGEKSEGYISVLENLQYTGFNPAEVQPFQKFTELNGHEVVRKYETPTTIKTRGAANPQKKKKLVSPMFLEHYDTENLRFVIDRIPAGAYVSFTEKLHGTSGRTGHVKNPQSDLTWWQRAIIRVTGLLGFSLIPAPKWSVVSGTRRVVLKDGEEGENGFYEGTTFRSEIHRALVPHLVKGETFYYEIVGYDQPCHPMFSHSIPDDAIGKEIKKRYGIKANSFEYSYGCKRELGEYRVYLYRITVTNEDGEAHDLSMDQVAARVAHLNKMYPGLNLHMVPQLGQGLIFHLVSGDQKTVMIDLGDGQEYPLKDYCNQISEGLSLVGDHIREGVCMRVTHPTMAQEVYKYKGFSFCHFEGIRKNDPDYIDVEEAA